MFSSQRLKLHRGRLMKKQMAAYSLADLVRIAETLRVLAAAHPVHYTKV
jgi:FixJ family two-component response regulator